MARAFSGCVRVTPSKEFRQTRCQALLAGMLLYEWYSQGQLTSMGGSRFPARLHEIVRAHPDLAYDVRCEDEAAGRYSYRLRERRPDEAPPEKRRSRVKALEAELASLRKVFVPLPGEELDVLLGCRVAEVSP
jgi:hypothetical protein